jgi:short-subunit dehydrogenase
MEAQMCNMECNACAAAMLTHHFVKQMLDRQLKGAVIFTSSAAAMMPAPFSVMYGSTKVGEAPSHHLSPSRLALPTHNRMHGVR